MGCTEKDTSLRNDGCGGGLVSRDTVAGTGDCPGSEDDQKGDCSNQVCLSSGELGDGQGKSRRVNEAPASVGQVDNVLGVVGRDTNVLKDTSKVVPILVI